MRFDRYGLGPLCGALALGAVIGASAFGAGSADRPANGAEGASVTPVFAYDLPHLRGRR